MKTLEDDHFIMDIHQLTTSILQPKVVSPYNDRCNPHQFNFKTNLYTWYTLTNKIFLLDSVNLISY